MRVSILQKLIAGFLIMAIIAGGAGAVYVFSLSKVTQSFLTILERQAVLKSYADNLQFYATSQNGSLHAYLLTRDAFYKSELMNTNTQMNELFSQTQALLNDPKMVEQLVYMNKLNQQYKDKANRIFELPKEQVELVTQEAKTGVIPLGGVIVKFAQQLSRQQDQLMNEEKEANIATVTSIRRTVVMFSVTNLVLALGIGFLIWRMIAKPIRLLSKAANSISAGDLAIASVRVHQRDELGQFAQAFNQMTASLRQLVVHINGSTQEVITISKEVSTGTEQTGHAAEQVTEILMHLSESADKQMQHAGHSLQAVHEICADIQHIDTRSQQAKTVVMQALEKAEAGDHEIAKVRDQMDVIQLMMNKLEAVMKSMQARSNEIEEINKAIAFIASQTNLLALNAAIEAARAGEHGRSFAVVTAEIRKLSTRTDASAKRVTELVSNIQSETRQAAKSVERMVVEVSKGINASHSVSELFGGIKLLVGGAVDQISEVTASSHQLSAYAQEIVQAMELLSELSGTIASSTQHVASVTEEQLAFLQQNAAHATNLFSMAEKLQASVHQFKV